MATLFSLEKFAEWFAGSGMTQSELGAALGVSRVTVSRWLAGVQAIPATRHAIILRLMQGGKNSANYQEVIAVPVRFTSEEWAEVQKAAGEGNDAVEQYLREAVLAITKRSHEIVGNQLKKKTTDS